MSYKDLLARKARMGVEASTGSSFSLQSLLEKSLEVVWRSACLIGYCVSAQDIFDSFKTTSLTTEIDPFAHMILAFAYVANVNLHIGATVTQYTKEEGGADAFKDIVQLPRVYSSSRISTLRDFATENTKFNEAGYRHVPFQCSTTRAYRRYRHLWMTATFKLNTTLISRIYDVFLSEADQVRSVKGAGLGMNFQPLTLEIVRHFGKNGGNPLGLEDVDEPLMSKNGLSDCFDRFSYLDSCWQYVALVKHRR